MTERPLPPAAAVAATGEHEDPITAASSPRLSKGSRKANEINSFSELLAYAYSRAGRSFAITAKVRKALAGDTTEPSVLVGQITRLAVSDPLLAVPPKVLIAMERARVGGRLRETFLELVTASVRQHPGLASIDVAVALSDEPPQDRRDALIRSLQEALRRLEPGDLGKASLRSAERRTLQDNAVLSVALLLAIKHGWSAATLADCLDTNIWREDLAAAKVSSERALIADGTSPTALALVARAWREKLTDQTGKTREAEAEARDAHRRWQEAVSRADAQALAREQTEKVLAQREETIASLERELASEGEQRRIDKSHAIDDYETLRAQIVRGLAQQTSLLEDGLHALRNDRLAVTEEYVERVIDSLREDLQRLRDGVKRDRGA